MKNDGTPFFIKLRTETNTVALGWLVTRADGVQLGFTSWDEPFDYLGVTYNPSNAFQGSANTSKSGLAVENMSAEALLTAEIEEKDLKGGLYDNALVRVFWVDPTAPEDGILPLRGGRFGELTLKQNTFEVELRSPAQKLQQPYCDVYTLECAARLGDARCKVKMDPPSWSSGMACVAKVAGDASIGTVVKPTVHNGFWYVCHDPGTTSGGEPAWPTAVGATVASGSAAFTAFLARRQYGTVTGVYNRAVFSDTERTEPVFFFQYGELTWLSGENEGITVEVRSFAGTPYRQFILMEAMPYPIALGDAYTVTQGCPKTKVACKEFDNIMNMRGFPWMPTEDKALETPNFSSQGEEKDEDDGGIS